MRATSENYKGIEYIRISTLPVNQRKSIYKSINHKLIINILKDNSMLNDCLQYEHYIMWYENVYKTRAQERLDEVASGAAVLTLAFK